MADLQPFLTNQKPAWKRGWLIQTDQSETWTIPRDKQLLVNFHQKGCDWSTLERLTGNCLLAWHLHDVTSSPSVTSASFPSRFLIGPFEWVSLVSMQVSDWSIWVSHVVFWTTVIASYQSLRSDWSMWKILLSDWLFVVGSEVYFSKFLLQCPLLQNAHFFL